MGVKHAHIIVSGQVQGVFYRAHAFETAKQLNLKGIARNTSRGEVEIIAEGEEEKLHELVKWCHKGSPASKVTDVKATYSEPTGEFDSFKVRYF